jgi:hypothetical protein
MSYRKVGNSSEVEDALFGFGSGTMGRAGRSIISADQLTAIRTGGRISNTAVINSADLDRMKRSTLILSTDQIRDNEEQREAGLAVKRAASNARKARMAQKAAESAQRAPKSDVELLAAAEQQAMLQAAGVQRDEQLDSVKMLNTLGARAAAFTIRQQQLKEKEEREVREREYDDRMNAMMELDRLKDLQKREHIEHSKLKQRLVDKEVLMQQIDGRRKQRLRDDELREVEKKAMLVQLRKNEEIEIEKMKEKAQMVKKSQREVEIANQRALEMRKKQSELEKLDDLKIQRYEMEKARLEQQREEEAAEVAKQAELQTAKLRAQQEKMQDNQAALDELRAKRAAEEKERRARAEEIRAMERKMQQMEIMREARKAQSDYKDLMLAREVTSQNQEYQRIIANAAQAKSREDNELVKQRDARYQHVSHIRSQISAKESMRKLERGAVSEEGRNIKMDFAMERQKLERIRKEHVEKLTREGVDPTYLTEMKRADMAKLQMR